MECLDAHEGGCGGNVKVRELVNETDHSHTLCENHWIIRLAFEDETELIRQDWLATARGEN